MALAPKLSCTAGFGFHKYAIKHIWGTRKGWAAGSVGTEPLCCLECRPRAGKIGSAHLRIPIAGDGGSPKEITNGLEGNTECNSTHFGSAAPGRVNRDRTGLSSIKTEQTPRLYKLLKFHLIFKKNE